MWTPLTREGVDVLGRAVYECLQRWTALQLAVHNGWGGANSALKCQQFHSDIVLFFTSAKEQRYIDELEEFLDERMLELFSAEIEDGSIFEVAEEMMTLHEASMSGDFEKVRRLSTPASRSGQSVLDSRQLPGPEDEVGTSVASDERGVEAEGMDVEDLPTVPGSGSASKPSRTSLLTQEEVADGWQDAPIRKGRRGRT